MPATDQIDLNSSGAIDAALIYRDADKFKRPSMAPYIARVRDKRGSARIYIMGDSRCVGSKAGDAGNNIDNRKNSWPVKLAAKLRARGINARSDSWFGPYYPTNGAPETSAVTYDPDFSFGVFQVVGRNGFNGRLIEAQAAGDPVAYRPKRRFNALEVYFPVAAIAGASSAQVYVDEVLVGTYSCSTSTQGGAERMEKITITGLVKKVQTIKVVWVGGIVRLAGLVPYCTDESELLICSVSLSGATTTQFNSITYGYSPNYSPTYFPRDETIVPLGTNDVSSVLLATFIANLDTIDTAHGAGGKPVTYMVNGYQGDASQLQSAQDPFYAAIREKARTAGRKLIDIQARWGTFAQAQTAGFTTTDVVHDSALGHDDMASAVCDRLLGNV